MEPLEEEEEGEEEENVDEEEEPPKKKKNKRAKRGPRGLWKQDLVDDLVDIIITNDYYQRKLIFVNTKNQQNGKVYEKVLKELKSRAGGKGNSVPFTVGQVRTKFKKCISECKKAALTIKTATGVKRFQDDKYYGVWFDRLFELVKTRDSCRPDLATEPLMNVAVTDCNDDVDNEDQDLAKDHPSTQLFVPVKTAPQKRKRKGDNNCTDIQNTLNNSLDKANSWFKLNRMIPNTKKTKHLLIGSVQKLIHSSETAMEIYIDNIKLEEAAGEKLLGVVIDSNLS